MTTEQKLPVDHSRPRRLARQVYIAKAARDPKLCACDSYLHDTHHHCEGCGFPIHHTERFCSECMCEQDAG